MNSHPRSPFRRRDATLLSRRIIILLSILLLIHCQRKQPPGKTDVPPKPPAAAEPVEVKPVEPKPIVVPAVVATAVPAVVATAVPAKLIEVRPGDAALVWIIPPPAEPAEDGEPDGSATENDPGAAAETKKPDVPGVRTFWVSPDGGAWKIVAQRPGLFLAVGDQVYEARLTRFHLETRKLPKESAEESEFLAKCRELMAGGESLFDAEGDGLVLRNLATGKEREVLAAPKSIAALNWVSEYHRQVEFLGGLGGFLFLRVRVTELPCGTDGRRRDEFLVFDLGRLENVTARLLAGGKGTWMQHFGLEKARKDFAADLKKQLREYEMEYEASELVVAHVWPVFPPTTPSAGLQVTYSYPLACTGCPPVERQAPAGSWPPELASWQDRHPAIDPVVTRLPATWRVAGVTRLTGSLESTAALRARFEAIQGKELAEVPVKAP